jgi:hypothetical protein
LHDNVEVPDPDTLFGVSVQVSPVAGLMLEDRLTAPPKPWSAVIVTVEVAAVPAFTVIVVGLTAIVKSWTVNVIVAV